MSIKSLTNQTIALAGVAQACSLVSQIATSGNVDQQAMRASIGSLLKIDSDSVADVYGGLAGVSHGLELLDRQLTNRMGSNPEQSRYAAQLIHLQGQLAKNADMLSTIHAGILKAQTQAEHFDILHENILANLADIYLNTISTLQPRIMVNGDQQHLSHQAAVNKVRALLLAGIRASLLWRQCGGSRWHLMLSRKKLLDEAKRLLLAI